MTAGYEEILAAMQDEYTAKTGFSPDDASDAGIRLKVLAGELSKLSQRVEALRGEAFPQTAGGVALERHAQTRGIVRKAAAQAQGTLRFSRATPAQSNIFIPAGTVCAAGGADSVRYETTAQSVILAGATQGDAPARAVLGGAGGNAAPASISALVTPVQGVAAVTNPQAFAGGTDAESDDQLRERLLRSFANISNGTNAAFYYDFAMGFEGVASANVVPREYGTGTVGVYVAGVGGGVPAALVEQIRAALAEAREINVDVRVKSAVAVPVAVTLEAAGRDGVDFEILRQTLTMALKAYFSKLAVGQSLLTARLGEALYHTPGLYNYKLTAPAQDVQAKSGDIFVPGTITVNKMAVVV